MYWKIICYNGDTWEAKIQMSLTDALALWTKETNNVEISIKNVINLS